MAATGRSRTAAITTTNISEKEMHTIANKSRQGVVLPRELGVSTTLRATSPADTTRRRWHRSTTMATLATSLCNSHTRPRYTCNRGTTRELVEGTCQRSRSTCLTSDSSRFLLKSSNNTPQNTRIKSFTSSINLSGLRATREEVGREVAITTGCRINNIRSNTLAS